MDAVKLLKADHDRVRELFEEFESAGERAHKTKQRIAEQVMRELEVHTQIEQEIFYPAVEAAGDELQELVAEGVQEHHVVDLLMQELRAMAPDDPEYEPKFTVLQENVEHHAEEEEKEMFPKARQVLRAELDDLGERMEARKEALMAGAR